MLLRGMSLACKGQLQVHGRAVRLPSVQMAAQRLLFKLVTWELAEQHLRRYLHRWQAHCSADLQLPCVSSL